ncbi:hypothetical protein D3C87_848010 [compost metagenome]
MAKRVTLTRPEREYPDRTAQGVGGGSPPKGGKQPPPKPDVVGGEKTQVEKLAEQAASMTAADRKELLARLSLDEQHRAAGKQDPASELWATAVHEALLAAAGRAGGDVPGVMVVRRLVASPSAYGPVRAFMESAGLAEKLDNAERFAFYRVLARLVVKDAERVCEWSGAPLGVKTVVQRAAHVRGIFDGAFPTYLRNGLAHVVARRIADGGRVREEHEAR